jgi:hypothetical protein
MEGVSIQNAGGCRPVASLWQILMITAQKELNRIDWQ